MTLLFNSLFINKIKRKYHLYKLLLISLVITYLMLLFLFILIHNSLDKYLFIIILTIVSIIDFSLTMILLKSLIYYNKLLNVICNSLNYEYVSGIVKDLNTYAITINGLLYNQYELVNEQTQIIYVLNGIDISSINNKYVKIGIVNNILYCYEECYE